MYHIPATYALAEKYDEKRLKFHYLLLIISLYLQIFHAIVYLQYVENFECIW